MKNLFSCLLLLSFALARAQEKKIIYYPNGNKHYEFGMKNDLLDGRFSCYYENGVMMMNGTLSNNQKISQWMAWDQQGILREIRNYTTGNQFEIINEWDKNNHQILPGIINEKNMRIIQAANNITSPDWDQVLINRRLWKTIKKEGSVNDFLFAGDNFFNALIDGLKNNELSVFEDDRFVYVKNKAIVNDLKNANVVEYRIKEDVTYYKEQKTIRRRIIGICPVIQEDCNLREIGWFYWPDVVAAYSSDKDFQPIMSNLHNQVYAGTVIKTTLDTSKKQKWREVNPDESLLIQLRILQDEASIWIYQVDNGF